MKIYKAIQWSFLSSVLLILPNLSYAADLGIYGGVGMGYAILKEQAPNADKSDTGAKLYGGMRIVGPLAIEAGYYNLGKYSNQEQKITGTSITAVGNVYTRSVNIFAKAGIFNWTLDDSASGTSLSDTDTTFGLGMNIPIEKNVSVRMEWEHFAKIGKDAASTSPGQDMSLLSFGVNFMF